MVLVNLSQLLSLDEVPVTNTEQESNLGEKDGHSFAIDLSTRPSQTVACSRLANMLYGVIDSYWFKET